MAGNRSVFLISAVLTLLPALLCNMAQAAEAGSTREVLLDNDTVQVVHLIYPPGTESGMHTHPYPHRVVYVVKGGTLELIPGDGSPPVRMSAEPGQVVFRPADWHNVRNAGNTEVELIETEIKQ